jgi:hypothetical protein
MRLQKIHLLNKTPPNCMASIDYHPRDFEEAIAQNRKEEVFAYAQLLRTTHKIHGALLKALCASLDVTPGIVSQLRLLSIAKKSEIERVLGSSIGCVPPLVSQETESQVQRVKRGSLERAQQQETVQHFVDSLPDFKGRGEKYRVTGHKTIPTDAYREYMEECLSLCTARVQELALYRKQGLSYSAGDGFKKSLQQKKRQ